MVTWMNSRAMRLVTVIMAFFLAAFALMAAAAPASATTLEKAKGTQNVAYYPVDDLGYNQIVIFAAKETDTDVPTKVSVSNKKVLQVSPSQGFLFIELKKAGTSTVKYTWKGKQHTVVFKVKKYTNPMKTFTVGKKNLAKKYKKANTLIGQYSGKLNIKAASGWKLKKTEVVTLGFATKAIKSGTKVSNKKHYMVTATFKNKKTKVSESVVLILADPNDVS